MRPLIRSLFGAATATAFIFTTIVPSVALTVFDPKNFAQNLLGAVRTLQVVNNQIEQLQNEARVLTNMGKHLERLDYSSATQLQFALNQIGLLMHQAEGLAFDVAAVEAEYVRLYPHEYTTAVTSDALVRDARERWALSRQAFKHSMLVQSQITANLEQDTATLDRLLLESQSAVGSLQAQQASNELAALAIKQQLQTQQLLAVHHRAEALERARAVLAQEHARVEFERFVGDGRFYTPLD